MQAKQTAANTKQAAAAATEKVSILLDHLEWAWAVCIATFRGVHHRQLPCEAGQPQQTALSTRHDAHSELPAASWPTNGKVS